MTNNRVTVAQSGQESVVCDRSDGMGVELLERQGLSSYVLSREDNPLVAARCKKLDLECSHSVRYELPELEQWAMRILRQRQPPDSYWVVPMEQDF